MNIVCIIPARGGSKGLYKKNITNFLGKPLITYSISQALKSKYITKVYVSSDDEEILKISEEAGANVIKRPPSISGEFATSESALLHVIKDIEESTDIVVFLQATSPLREGKDIDNAVEHLLNYNCDSVFSACNLEDLFIWEVEGENLKSINYDYNSRKRRQDISNQMVENGSIYVFRLPSFLIEKNRLHGKIGFSIMENWKVHEIDSLEDLNLCEFIYKERIENE